MRTQLVDDLLADLLRDVRFLRVGVCTVAGLVYERALEIEGIISTVTH